MGAVAGIAIAVGGAIASAASAVAAVVGTVVSAVAAAVSSIAAAIGSVVGTVVSAVTSAVSAVASGISSAVSYITTNVVPAITKFAGTIYQYAESIYTGMKGFLEAIHFKTIMAVHRIGYILSGSYRRLINRVYNSIADMGEAIGASRDGIIMAFKNMETLVKDTGAVMGKAYDLADVTWLKTLQGYLKNAGGRIGDMHHGLVDILPDIEEKVIKPTLDGLASFQRGKLSLFESLGAAVDDFSGKISDLFTSVDTVVKDLNKTVEDLPDTIKEEMQPTIDAINENFIRFRKEIYLPFKESTDDLINVIRGKQDQYKKNIDGIVDRLLYPGDILKGVEDLSIGARIDQENKVGDIASRPMKREGKDLEDQAAPSFEHLRKLEELIEAELAPPKWKIAEAPGVVVPVGGQSKKAATWFVGDF